MLILGLFSLLFVIFYCNVNKLTIKITLYGENVYLLS